MGLCRGALRAVGNLLFSLCSPLQYKCQPSKAGSIVLDRYEPNRVTGDYTQQGSKPVLRLSATSATKEKDLHSKVFQGL